MEEEIKFASEKVEKLQWSIDYYKKELATAEIEFNVWKERLDNLNK